MSTLMRSPSALPCWCWRHSTDMLSRYTSNDQKDWDLYLPYVLYAYRMLKHSATGETPFFMTYKYAHCNKKIINKCLITTQSSNWARRNFGSSESVENTCPLRGSNLRPVVNRLHTAWRAYHCTTTANLDMHIVTHRTYTTLSKKLIKVSKQ